MEEEKQNDKICPYNRACDNVLGVIKILNETLPVLDDAELRMYLNVVVSEFKRRNYPVEKIKNLVDKGIESILEE